MSTGLKRGTIVQLTDCRIQNLGDHLALSGSDGGEIRCRPDVLDVLEFFTAPRSLEEAARKPAFAHDWMRYTRSILALIDAGILQAVDAPASEHGAGPGLDTQGFGGAREHIHMLNDRDRTQAYINAIEHTVKPGDTVIDLGCGTGILAAAAAKHGATRIHAIERSGIAEAAERVFSHNRLTDRIRLHKTAARNVHLDERADLLVTELVGNEPLSERILEHVIDAKARLLKPGAAIIPHSLAIYAQCFSFDPALVDSYQFSVGDAGRWSEWYGIDLTPLADMRTRVPLSIDFQPETLMRAIPCSEPHLITSIEFANVQSAYVLAEVSIPVTVPAEINGVYVSFDIKLAGNIHVRRLIGNLTPDSSWNCHVWLSKQPIPSRPGNTIDIIYRHDPLGSHLEFS